MTSKEIYAMLDRLGMCHRCQKAPMFHGKKYCAECLEKIANYNATHYDSEKAKAYQGRRRELYRQHIAEGKCVRCSKKATHGLYCYECSIKVKKHNAETAAKRKRKRSERGLIPEIRKEQGLCLRCGNAVPPPFAEALVRANLPEMCKGRETERKIC